MIVAILGGGHIGTTMAGYMSHLNKGNEIRLLTSKPQLFDKELVVNDIEGGISYKASIDMISDNAEEIVSGADIIFVTHPHFMIDKTLSEIRPYVKSGCMVGIIPGSGGCEFCWKKYYSSDFTLFGFQRVPFTAKYAVYGKETNLKSWKSSVVVASIPNSRNDEVCTVVEDVCGFNCEKAANFLAVTLTPSNPVLHTSRTYDLFGGTDSEHIFSERMYFYKGWTDHASETMLGIDGELHRLFDKLPRIDLSAVKPLTEHYEAPDIPAMTRKINSIPTFQSVFAPLLPTDGGFRADLGSRFFTEDFPYGLCIIKGFCEICGVESPYIDKVLKWYSGYMGLSYYIGDSFSGSDLKNTGIPQNYGINSIEDIYDFYL